MEPNLTAETKKTKKEFRAETFTGIISKITGIYVFLMCTGFTLFVVDMYYNILKDKYYFFFYATLACAGLCLLTFLFGLCLGAFRGKMRASFPGFTKLTGTDWLFLAFFACAAVSTFTSEWLYESFWGNMGRLQGLFFYIICLVSYFLITRFFRFRPVYAYAFVITGCVMCLWGVLDYLGLDPLGWREDANDYMGMLIFTSTIGNVNTYTECASVFAGAASALAMKHRHPLPFYLAAFICFAGLITGTSDNALLGMAGIFGLLPFWCFDRKKGVIRYLLLLFVLALSFASVGILTEKWTGELILKSYSWGVLLKIANGAVKPMLALSAASLVFAGFLRILFRKKLDHPATGFRILWFFVFFGVILLVVLCFADANRGNHAEFWAPYKDFMIFNDRWGTNRGYAWRSSFEFFRGFSLWKKLFGSGPETYAIFMGQYNYYEMIDFMDAVFDSPHSEPIQMLFTTGILGFLAYYGAMITAIIRAVRKNKWAAVFAFALVGYLFASAINISVPISTPFAVLCLGLAASVKYQNEQMA